VIVIDANVAVKWYLPEAGTEAALELFSGPSLLCAPDLIRLEVLAALTRRVRNGEATAEETISRCVAWRRHLRSGTVSLVAEQEILDDALGLSLQIRHNLQDCLYLAIARRFEAPLITADRPFHDRALPLYSRVSLLPGCEGN
jgi:predicted nucleic acid-binding protein